MSENETQEHPPYQNDYRVFHWPKWRTWKRIFLVLLILLILGDVYLHIWVSGWVKEKTANDGSLSPEVIAEMKQFWDKTIDFPKEWVQEKPASQALQDAYLEADSLWEDLRKNKGDLRFRIRQWIEGSNVLPKTGNGSFLEDVEKIEPLVQAALTLSEVMKKEAENGSSCFDFPDLPSSSFHLGNSIDALKVKARALYIKKEFEKAFDCYLQTPPLMITHPIKDFFFHFTAARHINSLFPEIEPLLAYIKKPRVLRDGLEMLNWTEPFLLADFEERNADFILLSNYYGQRPSIDLSPGKKAVEYIQQYVDLIYGQYGFSSSLDRIIGNYLSGRKPESWERERMVPGLIRPFVFTKKLNEYMLIRATPWREISRSAELRQEARRNYDVLRLQIAARLYEMETGKKVMATTDLVPKYIPEELVTPESKNPYQWDSEGNLIVPFFQ